MILDSSAIVSVVEEEDGCGDLIEALVAAPRVAVGAPTLFEAAMILIARKGEAGRESLHRFVADNEVALIPFGADHWPVAAEAFVTFGKGRHPAGLNYGDCMTYATAKVAGAPLLFVGDDFARTDLESG